MNYNGLLEFEVLGENVTYFELDSVRLKAFFKKQCELRHMIQKRKSISKWSRPLKIKGK